MTENITIKFYGKSLKVTSEEDDEIVIVDKKLCLTFSAVNMYLAANAQNHVFLTPPPPKEAAAGEEQAAEM